MCQQTEAQASSPTGAPIAEHLVTNQPFDFEALRGLDTQGLLKAQTPVFTNRLDVLTYVDTLLPEVREDTEAVNLVARVLLILDAVFEYALVHMDPKHRPALLDDVVQRLAGSPGPVHVFDGTREFLGNRIALLPILQMWGRPEAAQYLAQQAGDLLRRHRDGDPALQNAPTAGCERWARLSNPDNYLEFLQEQLQTAANYVSELRSGIAAAATVTQGAPTPGAPAVFPTVVRDDVSTASPGTTPATEAPQQPDAAP